MNIECPYLLEDDPVLRTERLLPDGVEVIETPLDAPKYVKYNGLLMDAEDADYIDQCI